MTRALMASASVLALSLGTAAAAQQSGEPERIIVTGTSIETASGETLQSVEVLTIDELIRGFDGSLGASLAKLPGVSTTSFGPAVGRPIIRGLGGDRVRVLNNGVGLVDASQVSVDHASTTEVLDAEQVDILRGPAAIAYGGGAIGGVVNVVDGRIPTRPVDGPVDGQAYAGYTSVDEGYQLAGRARTGVGPLLLQLEASRREADDFDIPGFAESAILRAMEEHEHEEEHEEDEDHDHEEEQEAYGTVPNSGYTFETFGGGAALVGEWGYFGLSVRDYDAEYGLPGHDHAHEHEEGEEEEEEEHDHEEGDARIVMEQTRYDARGEIALHVGPFDHLDISAGFADYEHAELEPSGEIGTLFTNEGWEARAALVNGERGDRWSGSLGVQALATDFAAEGEEAFVPPVKTEDMGVFVAQRLDLGGYGFEGGLRFETRDLTPTARPSRSFDTTGAALGVFVRPMQGSFLSASLTRTERAPNDAELYSDGLHAATESYEIGNPDLGEETGLAFDVTYRLTRNDWVLEASAFASQFSDFIYLAPTDEEIEETPVFRYLQDDATLAGWELYFEKTIATVGAWDLIGDGAIEYVRGETDNFGDLPRMPPFSGVFGVNLERALLDLRAEVEYVAEQDAVAAFELPTDSYAFVNLLASAQPFGEATRLVVEVRNLADNEGRLHTSQLKDVIPLPGRSFRLGLHTTF